MNKITRFGWIFLTYIAGEFNSFGQETISLPSSITINVRDKERLQKGARLFMNYCSGCHSLHFLRYSRMAADLGITSFDGKIDKPLLKNNLVFTQASIETPIDIAMPSEEAKQWFGLIPPDLSLTARSHSPLWLYSYLHGFYSDTTRPFGTNNLFLPNSAMPNVLEPLIGTVILAPNSNPVSHLRVVTPGQMNTDQFDNAILDVVTFLVYVGEPTQLIRYKVGGVVIIFLLMLLVIVASLKKEIWKKMA